MAHEATIKNIKDSLLPISHRFVAIKPILINGLPQFYSPIHLETRNGKIWIFSNDYPPIRINSTFTDASGKIFANWEFVQNER